MNGGGLFKFIKVAIKAENVCYWFKILGFCPMILCVLFSIDSSVDTPKYVSLA
jgi:hypothetical protein